MGHSREYNDIIAAIYASSTMPERWSETAAKIQRYFGASHCNFFSYRADNLELITLIGGAGMDPDWDHAYNEHYASIDLFNRRFAEMRAGELFVSTRDLTSHQQKHDEYLHEFWYAQGFGEATGYVVVDPVNYASLIGMSRPLGRGSFSADELDEFRMLFPHLNQSVEIANRLFEYGRLKALRQDVLEFVPFGVAVVDERSRVYAANSSMIQLSDPAAKRGVLIDNTQLRLVDRRLDMRLQSLIAASQADSEKVIAGTIGISSSLMVIVLPSRQSLRSSLGATVCAGTVLLVR